MTRAVLPHTSAMAEWLRASLTDRVASRWTEHSRLMEATARTQTQDQTPQYQMTTMTTSLPSPVNKLQSPNLKLVTVARAHLSRLSFL